MPDNLCQVRVHRPKKEVSSESPHPPIIARKTLSVLSTVRRLIPNPDQSTNLAKHSLVAVGNDNDSIEE